MVRGGVSGLWCLRCNPDSPPVSHNCCFDCLSIAARISLMRSIELGEQWTFQNQKSVAGVRSMRDKTAVIDVLASQTSGGAGAAEPGAQRRRPSPPVLGHEHLAARCDPGQGPQATRARRGVGVPLVSGTAAAADAPAQASAHSHTALGACSLLLAPLGHTPHVRRSPGHLGGTRGVGGINGRY